MSSAGPNGNFPLEPSDADPVLPSRLAEPDDGAATERVPSPVAAEPEGGDPNEAEALPGAESAHGLSELPTPSGPPASAEPSRSATPPAGPSTPVSAELPTPPSPEAPGWLTRAGHVGLVVLGVVAVVIVAYVLAAIFLPRWWSNSVASMADGQTSRSIAWGLVLGFVFSFLPVLVIAQARRPVFAGWRAKLVVVGVGLVLALPNWLTLWITIGATEAADASVHTFDERAPYFRVWTLVGVAVGVVLAIALVWLSVYLSRRRARTAELEQRLRQYEPGGDVR